MGKRKDTPPGEKAIVVRVLKRLCQENGSALTQPSPGLLRRTAELTGFSRSSVARFRDDELKFGEQRAAAPRSGRPPTLDRVDQHRIGDLIRQGRKDGLSWTIPLIRAETGDSLAGVSDRTLGRVMNRMGAEFSQPRDINVAYDSPGVRALATRYLDLKLRMVEDGMPINVVGVLDETYIHVNHNNRMTWHFKGASVGRRRHDSGARLNVLGGGFYVMADGELQAGFVPDTLAVWNPKSSGAPRGRRPKDPKKLAAYEAKKTKYQGNANSDLFERWFADYLEKLSEYGQGVILMDNCRIHKRESWTVAQARTWLRAKRVSVSDSLSKKALKGLLKTHSVIERFAAVQMAKAKGFAVVYTPPYCPQTQPIETIWACAKNKVAARVTLTMAQLKTEVTKAFEEVDNVNTWAGAWRNVLRAETLMREQFNRGNDAAGGAAGASATDDDDISDDSDFD